MKLEGDYRFEAAVQEVWDALFDPAVLAAVMPGCEKLELVGEQYVGEIKIKVGPVQGKFTGKVDLVDRDEPRSYRMLVDGRGAPGFVKATAAVALEADGDGTRMRYDADAQIGGKLASVGQRLVEASARAIVAQSLEGLHENVKLRAAAYRAAAGAKVEPAPTPTEESKPAEPAQPAEPDKPAEAANVAEPAKPAVAEPAKPAEAEPAKPAEAEPAKPAVAEPAKPAVEFTPVKVTQSDVARRVAKEVASTMFPRSLLVAIIIVQFVVIVWLLLRG